MCVAGIGLGVAALTVGLAGCSEEEEPQQQVVERKPAPPPKPKVTPIDQLKQQMAIDERVMLPEQEAPNSDAERRALLSFFDAFARGDAQTLEEMMTLVDARELEALEGSGQLRSTAEDIAQIQIQTGTSPDGRDCALAVYFVNGSFQPQMWYYDGSGAGEFTFEAAPSPPGIIDQLHGEDWIAKWHEILNKEIELANKPDIEYVPPQQNLDEEGSDGDDSGSEPSNPSGPSGPSSPGLQ